VAITLAVAAALAVTSPAPVEETVGLDYRSYRTWNLQLPDEAFQKVSGSIPVAHAGGAGFAVEARSGGLAVDTDGDGTLESVIEGVEDPATKERTAQVVLTGTDPSGAPLRYTARLKNEGAGWMWAAGGAMVGKLGDTKITLVDLNGNGRYDDVGADAMAIGTRKVACFLSEAALVGDRLVTLTVDPAGTQLSATEFEGATGVLDFRSELETKGKLLQAVVRSADGRYSFDLASSLDGITVPVGAYEVVTGQLGLGAATVQVETSHMQPLEVSAAGTTVLDWGGPVRAEFEYDRAGDEVVLSPNKVWFIGAAGEQYFGWNPRGKSPEFTIRERDLGTELLKAVFPGSC